MIRNIVIFQILLLSFFILNQSHVLASGSQTINQGDHIYINWLVEGGTTCSAATTIVSASQNYPTVTDTWGGARASSGTNVDLGVAVNAGTWTLSCNAPIWNCNPASTCDSVTLTVNPTTNPCTGTPWGTIAHGNSVTAYQTPSVPYGNSCVSETRTCNNGTLTGSYTNTSCTPDPAPTGTLSSDATFCRIADNASSCAVNLSWTTANPITTSTITSNNPVSTPWTLNDSGTPKSVTVSGAYANVAFSLNNNGSVIAGPVTVVASCNSSSIWDTGSGSCKACGNGGCNPSTPNQNNPVTDPINASNPTGSIGGDPVVCNNGATDPSACQQCPNSLYWDTGSVSCKTCSNGGCNPGPGGNSSNPTGGLTCINGGTPPVCTPPVCNLPWGGTTASGNSVTAYQTSYVASPATCAGVSESRTCNITTLSGSYTNQTCVEGTASFTATPACNISVSSSGCNSTLAWTSANAGTVTLTDCGGGVYNTYGTGARSGSVYVPYNAGCYQIRDGGNNILATANPVTSSCTGGAAWNGTICVAVPTISLTASPASALLGATSTLTWTVSGGATSCSIDNGIGAVSTAGGSVGIGAISTTKTYTLSCSNAAGTATSQATVTYTPSAELTADLVSPAVATKGVSTTFSATIYNNGDTSTGASFSNFIQVADGPGGTGTVIDLAATSMADLASGGSDITAQSYTFTATGTYSMRACADKTNRLSVGTVTESNEGNNCGLWQDIAVAWPPITGTLSANPASCTISAGANTCTTDFTWTTTNPIGPSQVVGYPSGPYSSLAVNFTQTLAAYFGNQIFGLYNNTKEIASTTVTAVCTDTTAWEVGTSTCTTCDNGGCGNMTPNVCNNGANNPPACSTGGSMMNGWLTTAPTSCVVPTGASACNNDINLTWGVTNPVNPITAVTNNGGGTTYNGHNSPPLGQLTSVPFRYDGAGGSLPVTYYLYNNSVMLQSQQITVSCSAGANKWDTINNVCADPSVSAGIVGDYGYGSPSGISFSCLNSTTYEIRKDPAGANTLFDSGAYTGPKVVPLVSSATYSVICKHGSVSASQPVFYNSPPPPAVTISVNATPKTIDAGGKSTISWDITFPPLAPLCTLTAKPVCANNVCTAEQTAAAAALNTVIANGTTDPNDPSGSNRPITDPAVGAISTPVPGNPNHKALGKKTFDVQSTTDFVVNCGNGNTATTRVRVASSNEQ